MTRSITATALAAGLALVSVTALRPVSLAADQAASKPKPASASTTGSTAPASTAGRGAAAGSAPGASAATAQITPDLARLLAEIKTKDKGQLAISEEDGQFLRFLIASSQRRRALEIGAASGYSAIWIGLGLRETGGKLVTIEYDAVRAQEAMENVKRAGLSDVVQVIKGDAFQEIPKLAGTFDCVFVDAWKRDYIKFFDIMLPRMDKGGVFLGHNVINKKSEMGDFLARITTHPDLFTAIVAPSGEGISVSYKRK